MNYAYQSKNNLIIINILLTLFFSTNSVNGQEVDSLNLASSITNNFNEIKLDLTKDLRDQLIPLDSIIAIAIKNNPNVKSQDAIIRKGQEEVKLSKKEWQTGVFLSAVQSTGNQTQFYNSNNEPIGTQSQNKNTGYRLALNVNIPLYLFSARNNRIKSFKDELESRKEVGDLVKLTVSRQVIFEFNNMLASHNVLMVSSSAKATAHALVDMAEKEFKEGDVTIADYSGILAVASKADTDFELNKGYFYIWYQQLEQLLGVRIDTLVRKK